MNLFETFRNDITLRSLHPGPTTWPWACRPPSRGGWPATSLRGCCACSTCKSTTAGPRRWECPPPRRRPTSGQRRTRAEKNIIRVGMIKQRISSDREYHQSWSDKTEFSLCYGELYIHMEQTNENEGVLTEPSLSSPPPPASPPPPDPPPPDPPPPDPPPPEPPSSHGRPKTMHAPLRMHQLTPLRTQPSSKQWYTFLM